MEVRPALDYGNSQDMKFTSPTAMPTPKITPDKVRLAAPSPKANIRPPTTLATSAKPVAIGPVKAVCNACTACVHGDVVDCAKTSSASEVQAANVNATFRKTCLFRGFVWLDSEMEVSDIGGLRFSATCGHFIVIAAGRVFQDVNASRSELVVHIYLTQA